MRRIARYLFMSVLLLALLFGLAQAASQPLIGYCDVMCCACEACIPSITLCYCPGTLEVTDCWSYCAWYCGDTICLH